MTIYRDMRQLTLEQEIAALRAALERYRDPANWAQVRVNGTVWTVWRDGEPTHYAEHALAAQPVARTEEGRQP